MTPTTRERALQSVVAVAAAVAIVAMTGWLIPAVVVAVILMVVGHEFGHYITARMTGMKVTEFFVGFGPRVWSMRRGETEFGLKALPLGGYVRIVGMSTMENVDDVVSIGQKILVEIAEIDSRGKLSLAVADDNESKEDEAAE
mgnify:CR=1 FL=1